MTTPRPMHAPTVQQGRIGVGDHAPNTETVRRSLSVMPPNASRIETRQAVLDGWGRMSLAGNDGDRLVVPADSSGSGGSNMPILCAVAGFLLMSAVSRR